MPNAHYRSLDNRVCPHTPNLGSIARTSGYLVLALWVLLGTDILPAQAQTEVGVETPDLLQLDAVSHRSNAPEAADGEFEFDQTLGTSQDIDPFGGTPEEIVAQMLKMVELGKDDVVYDLGSGDGRIPIAAAQKAEARGVGIELRPELVERSRKSAEEAGVAELVQFIQADIFKSDISPATVVTLYLYPRTLLKLRPKLLSELRPGTRIVAYNYGIEGWPRDREQPVDNSDGYINGTLLLWIVPANVSGSWQGAIETPQGGSYGFTLELEQMFQRVSGKAVQGGHELPLKDVRLQGNTLCFSLAVPGNESLSLVATIEGHQLNGHAARVTAETESASERQATRMTWRARRDPATRTSIDPAESAGHSTTLSAPR
jgi:SAM-dependent methyltransferase